MLDWFVTPTASPVYGVAVILLVALANFVLMFLSLLTTLLQLKVYPVMWLIFITSASINIFLPHPTIRKFQDEVPFPPGDAIRLGLMTLGLILGVISVYLHLKNAGLIRPAKATAQ